MKKVYKFLLVELLLSNKDQDYSNLKKDVYPIIQINIRQQYII